MPEQTQNESLPHALFDAIKFSIYAEIIVHPEFSFEYFCDNLFKFCPKRPNHKDKSISVQIPLPEGGEATANLFLKYTPGTVRILSASTISINPLRMLRRELGEEACGSRGLDGNDNVIGQTDHRAQTLLQRQLELAGAAVESVTDFITTAIETEFEVTAEVFQLRSAETCLDLSVAHPIEILRRLRAAPMPGVTRTSETTYSKPSAHHDGLPCIRWRRPKSGPWYKVYVKREDLIRVEFCCPDRNSMRWLLGNGRGGRAINARETIRQLEAFAKESERYLHEMKDHALSALADDDATLTDLHIALAPLATFAAPKEGGQGRPISEATRGAARKALEMLLLGGRIELSLLGSPDTLKKTLEGMCSDDGPLQRRNQRAIYVLRPKFAKALSIG